ncbi:MAG: hypothetical protein QW035_03140 [Candidatus Anstonellales archaeon]
MLKRMKELTVKGENSVEVMARVAEALGSSGINIDSISTYAIGNNAYLRLLTADIETSKKALKNMPVTVEDAEVIVLSLQDRPGELAKVARKIANRGIELETMYIVGKEKGMTNLAIKPSKNQLKEVEEIFSRR